MTWGQKVATSQQQEKTPFVYYYPHSIPKEKRNWNQGFIQIVSIDPGKVNYAFRIERRYDSGEIIPIVFDKKKIESFTTNEEITFVNTFKNLTEFLDQYKQFYYESHYVIIEKQMPFNYQAVRISQHTISYFLSVLKDKPLLPPIIEVDSKLKGKMLGYQKGEDLKAWAVKTAREMFTKRNDDFSLGVLDYFKTKQDDLSDTACQIEAFLLYVRQKQLAV